MHIYKNRIADARFLIPILPGIPTQEAIALLPKLLVLPSASLKAALLRILHSKPAPLSPRELLVHLHLLNPTKDEVPFVIGFFFVVVLVQMLMPMLYRYNSLRKILEAMQVCFEDKTVVNQDCLAGVLQQLVDVTPIPPLFMRTVILSVSKVKTMMNSIMSLLTRLIIKQVWNDAGLWEGYMKCVKMTVPHSIPIMLSLPPPQFEELLSKNPDLRLKIVDYQKTVQRGIPASLQGIMDRLAAEAEAAAAAAKAAAAEEAAKKEAAIKADAYDPSAAAEDDDNDTNAPLT
jgi:symplekin